MQSRTPLGAPDPNEGRRRVWSRWRRKVVVLRNRFLLGMVSGTGSACAGVIIVWWQNRH